MNNIQTYDDFLNEGLIDKAISKIPPKVVRKAIQILDVKDTDSKKDIAIKILKFMIKAEIADWRVTFTQVTYTGLAFIFVVLADIFNIPPYVHDPEGILNQYLKDPEMMNLPGIITVVAAFIYGSIRGFKKYIKPLFKIGKNYQEL